MPSSNDNPLAVIDGTMASLARLAGVVAELGPAICTSISELGSVDGYAIHA